MPRRRGLGAPFPAKCSAQPPAVQHFASGADGSPVASDCPFQSLTRSPGDHLEVGHPACGLRIPFADLAETNRCAPACRGPMTFTHLVCAWGVCVIPSGKREGGMDLALGRFGDRRLEKGGPICWRGWWRTGRARCPGAAPRRRPGGRDPHHPVPAQPLGDDRGDDRDGLAAHRGRLRRARCPGGPGHDGDAGVGRRPRQLSARDDRRRCRERRGSRRAGRAVPGAQRRRPGEPPAAGVRGPPERPLAGGDAAGRRAPRRGPGHGGGGPRGRHVRALRPSSGPCRSRGARHARPGAGGGRQAGRGDRRGPLPRPCRARAARPSRGGGAHRPAAGPLRPARPQAAEGEPQGPAPSRSRWPMSTSARKPRPDAGRGGDGARRRREAGALAAADHARRRDGRGRARRSPRLTRNAGRSRRSSAP